LKAKSQGGRAKQGYERRRDSFEECRGADGTAPCTGFLNISRFLAPSHYPSPASAQGPSRGERSGAPPLAHASAHSPEEDAAAWESLITFGSSGLRQLLLQFGGFTWLRSAQHNPSRCEKQGREIAHAWGAEVAVSKYATIALTFFATDAASALVSSIAKEDLLGRTPLEARTTKRTLARAVRLWVALTIVAAALLFQFARVRPAPAKKKLTDLAGPPGSKSSAVDPSSDSAVALCVFLSGLSASASALLIRQDGQGATQSHSLHDLVEAVLASGGDAAASVLVRSFLRDTRRRGFQRQSAAVETVLSVVASEFFGTVLSDGSVSLWRAFSGAGARVARADGQGSAEPQSSARPSAVFRLPDAEVLYSSSEKSDRH